MALEHLTKQNHDLEEQLCQRDAGPNSHGEEKSGTNAKRRDREGLEGSNASSKQDQQDTSRPSVVETAPPHIVVEMQMMKERMAFMMNALKGRVSSDLDELVHQTDSPFTTPVTLFPLLSKFHMPQVEAYDGSKDPLNHLESFKTLMHLQGVADKIMCRAFLTTLKGPTRVWFNRLTPNSIITFKELSTQFALHFIGGQRYKKSTTCLMSTKPSRQMKLMTKYSLLHSPMGYRRGSFCFPYTKMTKKPYRMYFIELLST